MSTAFSMGGVDTEVDNSGHASLPWVLRHDVVRDGWATFIGKVDWHWFVTLTNRDGVSHRTLEKAFGVFVQRLGRGVAGRRWYRKDPPSILWASAFEHTACGNLHVHCLLASTGRIIARHDLSAATVRWRHRIGHVDFRRVTDNVGVVAYLAKEIGKGGELYVSPGLPRA